MSFKRGDIVVYKNNLRIVTALSEGDRLILDQTADYDFAFVDEKDVKLASMEEKIDFLVAERISK